MDNNTQPKLNEINDNNDNNIKNIQIIEHVLLKSDKLINVKQQSKITKRIECEKWIFTEKDYEHSNQLYAVQTIADNFYTHNNNITKIMCQQIKRKIHGYKQQDVLKKMFNNDKFLKFQTIIDEMIKCKLKCYYCKCEMDVLYNISREKKQWTIDRINNSLGHYDNNFYIACLECNLKRRRRNEDKFLFTKQLKLVKLNGENT